jgi:hypothetical protein
LDKKIFEPVSRLSISSLGDVLEHHRGKFIVRDFSITIFIDLLDESIDNRFIKSLTEGQDLLDLFGRDGTTTVLVEHLEGALKLVAG